MFSERHDLSIREPLDAVGLTRLMLDGIQWRERSFKPVIQPEVTPITDSVLLSHDVLLYHCGAPEQPGLNKRAWIWRYSLSLTMLGRDPERVARLCSWVDVSIAAWPWRAPTPLGRVTRIMDNPGFEIVSSGDITSSKSVVAWRSTKHIQASSPRG